MLGTDRRQKVLGLIIRLLAHQQLHVTVQYSRSDQNTVFSFGLRGNVRCYLARSPYDATGRKPESRGLYRPDPKPPIVVADTSVLQNSHRVVIV